MLFFRGFFALNRKVKNVKRNSIDTTDIQKKDQEKRDLEQQARCKNLSWEENGT